MKKIYNYLFIGIVAMLSMTLSSCDDDDIAGTLDGVWEGEVSQNFSWRWSNYSNYQYVDIEFYTDPYRYASGTGIEYDYDRWGNYTTCTFSFSVESRDIYLIYADGARVMIPRGYYLSKTRFEGEFRDYYYPHDYIADFSFVKVANHLYNRYNYRYSKELPFKEDNATENEANK